MRDRREIEDLRARKAPIEMSGEEFRRIGHRLVDRVAEYLDTLRERPVTREQRPSEIRAVLPQGALPETGGSVATLLDEAADLLLERSLFNGHPRFLSYITSSAAPIGALADLLAASINPNLGGWQLSPVASEIELQAVRWVAEFIGFPADCGGLFVSGGNVANFTCFLAARRARAPWNLQRHGLGGGTGRMIVYTTDETHTWIEKATDLFGHGTNVMHKIPLDGTLRADVGALRKTIEQDRLAGDHPFLLVASAGTVSTGAVDPIREMSEIAREHGLWLHVDGAYGALAAALPGAPEDLRALSVADSVAVDPHKWLYTPLEAGCVLVRDPAALPRAFSYTPRYYHFNTAEEPETNFYELGLQNSRGFRALKVWLSLRQVGRTGFVRMIQDDIRLAEEIFRLIDVHPEFEAKSQGLSITTFRFVPPDLDPGDERTNPYLDELNEALLARVKSSGEVFLSNAVVDGRFLLRSCIVNFRTSLEDVEALPEIVARHGRQLDRRLRPDPLRGDGQ
jgi:aromatic-L-amino-acid decarboxylase